MNYEETLEYLYTQLPMFQRNGPAAYKNSLDNTLMLDTHYHHPHRKFKTIHVAGTNGKGSVSHMLAAVLQEAGFKTGLYTSPHLKDFRERIKINGAMISREEVVEWMEKFRINNEVWKMNPSFFELTVALAFDYFSRQEVDFAVVEVGLGGRLDSTNIIRPELSIITNIALDHTDLLGNTLEKIAGEKAGIIKKNIPVVIGSTQQETEEVFKKKAKSSGASITFADKEYIVEYALKGIDGNQVIKVIKDGEQIYPGLELDLKGEYQLKNLPAVLKAIDILRERGIRIANEDVREGLRSVVSKTKFLGRWQIIGHNPQVICDTAHNEEGIKAIVAQIKNTAHKKLRMVFGTVADKDPGAVLQHLPRNAIYYFTKASIPRAMDEAALLERAREYGLNGKCYSDVQEALAFALRESDNEDLVFVGGSTFVVAEIL